VTAATACSSAARAARLRRRGIRIGFGAALVAAALAVLNACTPQGLKPCPRAAILNEASQITKFANGVADPNNALYTVEMTNIAMQCKYSGGTSSDLESNVKVSVTATRGPRYPGGVGKVDYFVIVTDRSGAVLAKRIFPIRFDLTKQRQLHFSEGSWMYVDLALRGGGGAGYEVWTGFQLNDAELQYNRAQLGK
jgi:hypothetical protein